MSFLIVLFLYHLCYTTFIFTFICAFLHLSISAFLCPYVNKVGGPNLSQCRIGHEIAISLVSLLTLLTVMQLNVGVQILTLHALSCCVSVQS